MLSTGLAWHPTQAVFALIYRPVSCKEAVVTRISCILWGEILACLHDRMIHWLQLHPSLQKKQLCLTSRRLKTSLTCYLLVSANNTVLEVCFRDNVANSETNSNIKELWAASHCFRVSFCIIPCRGTLGDKTLKQVVIIQAWRWTYVHTNPHNICENIFLFCS